MASIVNRGKTFSVVYTYYDQTGKRKQKWETYKTLAQAESRKKQIERNINLILKNITTVKDLCNEYIESYGKMKWSYTTYDGNCSLINRYILPHIGSCKLSDLNARLINKFYQTLLCEYSGRSKYKKSFVSPSTIIEINKLLKSIIRQANLWEVMDRNPMLGVVLPKVIEKKTVFLSSDQISYLIQQCDNDTLSLIIQIAFACSLRKGEILGLTWDDIDFEASSITVIKELIRIKCSALEDLGTREIIHMFTKSNPNNKTVLVLKTPKTTSSVRTVYIPNTLLEKLSLFKLKQNTSTPSPYNLIFTSNTGNPMDERSVTEMFKRYLIYCDLPLVVFHSLRHSSIMYKLELTNGNIKTVQGDSGHAESKMILDTYSHIIDKNRSNTAKIFEDKFYSSNKDSSTTAELISSIMKLSHDEQKQIINLLSSH